MKLSSKLYLSGMAALVLACSPSIKTEKSSRVATLPFYEEATFTPKWMAPEEAEAADFHAIRPFQLTNQNGQTVTEKTVEGKVFIVDFFFTTCPGICPKMTANMANLQESFAGIEDVLLLSHSVTPERDSVSVLREYADYNGVKDGKWHLLTGTQEEIYDLGRNAYFVEEDLGIEKGLDEFLHTENFVLVDKNRHIRGIYNGLNKTDLEQLVADVATLMDE